MRFGIVGCGEIGGLRATAIAAAGSSVVAVGDPDEGRRSALAGRTGARAYPDAATLVADPSVEAVVVATPPPAHLEATLAALAAGHPVLCEKPLATTPEDCRRMVDEASRRGLPLATGFNLRHYPAFARAHEALACGEIGELDFVRAHHGHPGGREFTTPKVHDVAFSGGGTLMDNGIHLVDLARHFLGDVAEVKGYRSQGVWRFPGCEDNGFALLRSRSGKVAQLQSSWSEWRGYGFSIEAYGTRGFVRASYPPMLFRIGRARAPGERPRVRREWFPWLQMVERARSYRWTLARSFVREIEDFVAAIAERREPRSSGRDGLAATEIVHAIYRSSDDGECVRLAGDG